MAPGRPIYVLGTGLSHDGSACLLKDGKICVAIEKERITRRKHDGFNDTDAIQYCLDSEGITISDLRLIVQNANFGMFKFGSNWFMGRRLVEDNTPIVTISHHLAHAYGAFGTSPFDEAAVIIIDGCGNCFDECVDLNGAFIPEVPQGEIATVWCEKDSYYRAESGHISAIYKDFSPLGVPWKLYPMYPSLTRHSIGGLYAAVSTYIFRGIDDSGKLMGLAPYGHPGAYDFEVFDLHDGRCFLRYDWMEDFKNPAHSDDDFNANFQEYADLAFWIQKEVERAVLYIIRSRYDFHPSKNLCYAGGVALNAVANRRILRETPFRSTYIQPAAGDNGLAVGCAYYGWLEVLKQRKVIHNGSTYFGRSYSRAEIERALEKYSNSIQAERSEKYIEETASILAQGQVVAWYQERSEFGPRALGNRSILADPRRPEMNQYLNKYVKFREDFRPFAPSVLMEDLSTYFDCDYESPYMLLVAPVRPEWQPVIPSVVHRDGSSRIQTVTEQASPTYCKLLREFKRHSGIGVLLNTSFNKRRMPIVETPQQAINFFLSSGIHTLVIDQYIVRKQVDTGVLDSALSTVLSMEIRDSLQRHLTEDVFLGGVYEVNVRQMQILPIRIPNATPDVRESQLGHDLNSLKGPLQLGSHSMSEKRSTEVPEIDQSLSLAAIVTLKR